MGRHKSTWRKVNRFTVFGYGVVVLCALGGLWYLGSLVKNGDICLVRTGIEPDTALYEPQTFRAFVEDVRSDAVASLVRRFDKESGFFVYSMHPSGEVLDLNNDIRQLLASRILAEESMEDESLRDVHRNNLDAIFSNWYREENGIGYVYADDKSKLGANAMLVRTLVASPFFDEYRAEVAALVRGIESLASANGSFSSPWYREPSYAYDADYLLTFYSGEALLALMEYVGKTNDQRAYQTAVRVQDFYITHYVTDLDENYYPAYVPWHTASLAHLYDRTKNKKYADAIFALTDELLKMQDTKNFIGRFYDPQTPQYGTPHGSSDAVYTEGLSYAYDIAKKVGDDKREKTYYDALVIGVHNIERLQYEPYWWLFDNKETGEYLSGGIKTTACNRTIRIDTTAHAVDAFTKLLLVLRE